MSKVTNGLMFILLFCVALSVYAITRQECLDSCVYKEGLALDACAAAYMRTLDGDAYRLCKDKAKTDYNTCVAGCPSE